MININFLRLRSEVVARARSERHLGSTPSNRVFSWVTGHRAIRRHTMDDEQQTQANGSASPGEPDQVFELYIKVGLKLHFAL